MAIYISLVNYTPQGIAKLKDSPARMDAAKKAAGALGGKIHAVYLTMGHYDGLFISEFPDDATASKFLFSIGSSGFMSTETLKAFSEEEFRPVLGSLG